MIHIDQKITAWERFSIDDKNKDAVLIFMVKNPSFTFLDLYDWAYDQGYDPHCELIEYSEETIDPYENKKEATIEIIHEHNLIMHEQKLIGQTILYSNAKN